MFSINLSKARRGKKNIINPSMVNFKSKDTTIETRLKLSSRSGGIKVKLFDKSNNLVKEFPTIGRAAKYLNVSGRTVSNIFKTGISYDNYIYKLDITTLHLIIVVNK
jgi:hypothetical protein